MNVDCINSAVNSAGLEAGALNEIERNALVALLKNRLGVDVSSDEPWDDRSAPEGRQRPDGWEIIPEYVGDAGCLMFLNGAGTVWRISDGSSLLRILQECPPFEFYVCDEGANYLLCCNHHDFVIGWGGAKRWVNESL